MPNTTNYSFPTPADTDLVKNGADAIRDLGDAVDTAMNTALGTKKAGMVLLNTTSFSGVASQAVPTVFSATYENYKIIVTFSAVSADGAIFMKLRSGATDSSTGYSTGNPGLTETGVAQNQYEAGITSGFRINTIDNTATADYYSNSIDLYKPFLTNRSSMSLTGVGVNTSGTFFGFDGGGQHTVASSYDGINIIASAGNISGKVSVYGYNL